MTIVSCANNLDIDETPSNFASRPDLCCLTLSDSLKNVEDNNKFGGLRVDTKFVLFFHIVRGDLYPHITQIAAREVDTGKQFNQYVLPKLPITAGAERITKIIISSETTMMVNRMPVVCVSIDTGLTEFFSWLNQFQDAYLVAHNGRRFDYPVLVTACAATENLESLSSTVTGLVDSITVFRAIYPKHDSYKQEDLVHSILMKEYNAHKAADDVQC